MSRQVCGAHLSLASQVSKSQNCMLPSLPPRARYGTAFVRPSSVHLNSVTRSSPFSITHSLSQSEREEPKHGRRLQVHSATLSLSPTRREEGRHLSPLKSRSLAQNLPYSIGGGDQWTTAPNRYLRRGCVNVFCRNAACAPPSRRSHAVRRFLGSVSPSAALWLGSIRQRRLKCLSGQRERGRERPIQASLWGTGNDGGADRMGDDHKSSTISAAGRTGNGQKSRS